MYFNNFGGQRFLKSFCVWIVRTFCGKSNIIVCKTDIDLKTIE